MRDVFQRMDLEENEKNGKLKREAVRPALPSLGKKKWIRKGARDQMHFLSLSYGKFEKREDNYWATTGGAQRLHHWELHEAGKCEGRKRRDKKICRQTSHRVGYPATLSGWQTWNDLEAGAKQPRSFIGSLKMQIKASQNAEKCKNKWMDEWMNKNIKCNLHGKISA